jgi:cytosine/adenosine deaminase-related metal-dependent hydrolase
MDARPTVFKAAFVFPIDQPPIGNGFVSVVNGLIESIGQWSSVESKRFSPDSVRDLGEVALIPALVNAHTHLEFSHLREPLGHPGMEFTQWIREIVRYRKTQNESEKTDSDSGSAKHKAIQRGLVESYRSGVGCIGEIATMPFDRDDYRCPSKRESEIDVLVFQEQLGRDRAMLAQKRSELEQLSLEQLSLARLLSPLVGAKTVTAGQLAAEFSHLYFGVSPHAPYSVHPALLDQIVDHAAERKLPVAMHLAETEAERVLLTQQTGPFKELLQDLGVWDLDSFLPAQSFTDILYVLSRCSRSLIVHGNFLRSEEIETIAKFRDRMAIVYCPRTHDYFRFSHYPLNELRNAGVTVAVGTDSRASNPDLNLYADLKMIASKFPELTALEILEMGTSSSAIALGLAQLVGNLRPGKLARLSVISNPSLNHRNWDWLFDKSSICCRVHV